MVHHSLPSQWEQRFRSVEWQRPKPSPFGGPAHHDYSDYLLPHDWNGNPRSWAGLEISAPRRQAQSLKLWRRRREFVTKAHMLTFGFCGENCELIIILLKSDPKGEYYLNSTPSTTSFGTLSTPSFFLFSLFWQATIFGILLIIREQYISVNWVQSFSDQENDMKVNLCKRDNNSKLLDNYYMYTNFPLHPYKPVI